MRLPMPLNTTPPGWKHNWPDRDYPVGEAIPLRENLFAVGLRKGPTGKVVRLSLVVYDPQQNYYRVMGNVREAQGYRKQYTPWKVTFAHGHWWMLDPVPNEARQFCEAWFTKKEHAEAFLLEAGRIFYQ